MNRIKHIDGLRAISILCVVFYHAFPSTFPNGYLGIDYFLVISGFVITKKYFLNPTGYFSFYDFWSKRILRLYPQLLTCIAVCTFIAWFTMSPDFLENFSQTSLASLIGLNNKLLYFTGGYWNLSNDFKPLFTTWSLGLEEQFYFLVSIVFAVSHKRLKFEILKKIFLILSISSLLASGFGSLYFRTANYLFLTTRFWEFAIGIYAAFLTKGKPRFIANWVTNLCFFVVLAISLAFPISTSQYAPNPLFLIPLSGIAIICISSNHSISEKILSSKPLVYTGLSSYAIYLYHQPLLAFARLQIINSIKFKTSIILVIGSFLIGWTMYELIENKRIFKLLDKRLLVLLKLRGLLILTLVLGFINTTIVINNGFFSLRFPHMLVDGKPPLGFLGGKGYVDNPNIYQSKKFPENNQESDKKNNMRTINIFLEGNSKTRDLINALEIIDSKNPKLKFNYSYNDPGYGKANKNFLDQADLVIKQIYNLGNKTPHISDSVLEEYGKYSEKIFWYRTRERFAKNINPIMFITNTEERANYKNISMDSYYCKKEDLFSNKFEPKNSGLGMIDSQCIFNDPEGLKILTSKKGELYSFDGVHLTFAGANELAKNLISSKKFRKILKI